MEKRYTCTPQINFNAKTAQPPINIPLRQVKYKHSQMKRLKEKWVQDEDEREKELKWLFLQACFANNGNSTLSVFLFPSLFSNELMSEGIYHKKLNFIAHLFQRMKNVSNNRKMGWKIMKVKKEQQDEKRRRAIFGHSIIPPHSVV